MKECYVIGKKKQHGIIGVSSFYNESLHHGGFKGDVHFYGSKKDIPKHIKIKLDKYHKYMDNLQEVVSLNDRFSFTKHKAPTGYCSINKWTWTIIGFNVDENDLDSYVTILFGENEIAIISKDEFLKLIKWTEHCNLPI